MRVVFLRSNPVAPDPRVEKEAKTLCENGYKIHVIGWDRVGDLSKFQKTEFGIIERIRIRAGFGSGIRNLIKILFWQFALIKWLIKSEFDVIHACDFDTIIPAFIVGKIKKKKVIYDIFDFYSDMVRNTPEFVKRAIKFLDYYIINHVDAVIIVDESRKEQIAGTRPKKLVVIYNTPSDILSEFKSPNTDHRFCDLCIGYVGLLQHERGLLDMISVVSRHPEWTLNIAGFGGDEDLIKLETVKFSNINFYGRIDYQKALGLSFNSDVLFATYDPTIPNHKYSSPNKLFEAMMLGKPIIVSESSSMADIVRKVKNGIVVQYGDKDDIEAALEKLQKDKLFREILSTNSRNAYLDQYSWDKMKGILLEIYYSFGI